MRLKPLLFCSFVILLLAAIVRFTNLNSLPIFADESIYIRWSQVMRAEPSLRFLPLSDGKQPFYMWATIPFFKIISDPLLAGRALSGLAGLATTIGVGIASYILFHNRRQALVSALIFAALPYAVFFDRMALSDSLLSMFLVWTFIFSHLSFQHRRLDLSMFAGFTLGFAWLTKSPAIFAFLLLPLNLFFLPKLNFKSILHTVYYLLFTYGIAFGMYNILRLGPEFQMIALRNKDYVFPWLQVLLHPLDPLKPHLKDSLRFYLYFATPFGLLSAFWGIFSGRRGPRFLLAFWWLIPILVQSFLAKQFTARYLLFTVPFAVILMGNAIEHLGQRTKKHFLVFVAASMIVIPAIYLDYLFITQPESAHLPRIERSGYLEEWTAGYGLRDISQKLKLAAQSGSVLVGSEGFFGTPFDALQLYLNNFPNVRVIGVGVWIDSVHEKLINALADNQVFLVVNSTRFHANPDDLIPKLKLISSYPKAIRPNGSQEYLLFFQVLPQ